MPHRTDEQISRGERHERADSCFHVNGVTTAVLHVAPHPDDELLGAPAALMAMRDAGHRVVNLACSLGHPDQHERRQAELENACRRAGFELQILQPPVAISRDDDEAVARRRLVEVLLASVAAAEPFVVVSPSPHDRHHGHALVACAVLDALTELGTAAPRWWMWELWSTLERPTLAVAFDAERLEQIIWALRAHHGELERNDYERLVRGRAEMNAALAPEVLFGFGSPDRARAAYADLLTEIVLDRGRCLLGAPRWLHPSAPVADPSENDVTSWLVRSRRAGAPSPRSRRTTAARARGDNQLGELEQRRLWDHRLHEDRIFSDRQIYFLVAQSMLGVAYATTLLAPEGSVAGEALASTALTVTLLWMFVNRRQLRLIGAIHQRAIKEFREFAETYRQRPLATIRSTLLLAYGMPPAIGGMWIVLLLNA